MGTIESQGTWEAFVTLIHLQFEERGGIHVFSLPFFLFLMSKIQ